MCLQTLFKYDLFKLEAGSGASATGRVIMSSLTEGTLDKRCQLQTDSSKMGGRSR